ALPSYALRARAAVSQGLPSGVQRRRGRNMSEGKVAVVTGASSGIGRAVAIGLGRAGYRVAILGRREEPLAEAMRLSGAAYSAPCDAPDPAAVHRFFSAAVSRLGRVDDVFNNPGQFARPALFGDVDVATWQGLV